MTTKSRSLRWRKNKPQWISDRTSYDYGRDPENDDEPYATVSKRSTDGVSWYWYGSVGKAKRNTVDECFVFVTEKEAMKSAEAWVRQMLGRKS